MHGLAKKKPDIISRKRGGKEKESRTGTTPSLEKRDGRKKLGGIM